MHRTCTAHVSSTRPSVLKWRVPDEYHRFNATMFEKFRDTYETGGGKEGRLTREFLNHLKFEEKARQIVWSKSSTFGHNYSENMPGAGGFDTINGKLFCKLYTVLQWESCTLTQTVSFYLSQSKGRKMYFSQNK